MLSDESYIDENLLLLLIGLQFWVNMKPFSNQPFGPKYIPFTVGVSGKDTYLDQKTSLHKLRPGFHTTIHVIPKILKTTSDFNNLHLNARNCKLAHETTAFQLLREYSQKGCELECAVRKATSFCQCLPWQYPNNFQSWPICDMFGGFCFNTIVSDIVYHKNCKSECYEDCKETSFATWHSTVPLDAEDLCKYNTFFDRFIKQNFQRLFALENYQMLIREQSTLDLALRFNNGSLCISYIKKYVSLVSVETPTKGVTKSQRDQRKFFIDKLGTIGGTLGVSAGMSVISMIEVVVLLYLILDGILHDVIDSIATFRGKIVSFLNGSTTIGTSTSALKTKSPNEENIEDYDFEEDEQEIQKIYVSINFECFGKQM